MNGIDRKNYWLVNDGMDNEKMKQRTLLRDADENYSVRIFFEFFSVLPGKQEPVSVHRLPGVNVDVSL